jgi:hypothetical protein
MYSGVKMADIHENPWRHDVDVLELRISVLYCTTWYRCDDRYGSETGEELSRRSRLTGIVKIEVLTVEGCTKAVAKEVL